MAPTCWPQWSTSPIRSRSRPLTSRSTRWSGRTAEYHCKWIREAFKFRPSMVADEKALAEWLAAEVCPVELVEDRQRGAEEPGRW